MNKVWISVVIQAFNKQTFWGKTCEKVNKPPPSSKKQQKKSTSLRLSRHFLFVFCQDRTQWKKKKKKSFLVKMVLVFRYQPRRTSTNHTGKSLDRMAKVMLQTDWQSQQRHGRRQPNRMKRWRADRMRGWRDPSPTAEVGSLRRSHDCVSRPRSKTNSVMFLL